MSQLRKKFIGNNEIDHTKVRLSNDQSLRGRNAADSGDIDIIKLSATDKPDLNGHQLTNVADPTSAQDVTTKNYVDTSAGYTVANAGDWAGTPPATVQQALDRLAAAVASLLTTPVP